MTSLQQHLRHLFANVSATAQHLLWQTLQDRADNMYSTQEVADLDRQVTAMRAELALARVRTRESLMNLIMSLNAHAHANPGLVALIVARNHPQLPAIPVEMIAEHMPAACAEAAVYVHNFDDQATLTVNMIVKHLTVTAATLPARERVGFHALQFCLLDQDETA